MTALSVAYHEAAQCGRGSSSRRLARQTVAERQALAEIEAALERIAAGRYGRCEECARPIAAALLAALPQARYCAACGSGPVQRIAHA